MKDKLNLILLIDDDEPTNYLNELIINEVDCTQQVVAVENAQQALDFLKKTIDAGDQLPAIIFLDINMPAINGWEFIEEYKQLLTADQQESLALVMLTTSMNPDDEKRAMAIPEIDSFKQKPLSEEMLEDIIGEFYPEKV